MSETIEFKNLVIELLNYTLNVQIYWQNVELFELIKGFINKKALKSIDVREMHFFLFKVIELSSLHLENIKLSFAIIVKFQG